MSGHCRPEGGLQRPLTHFWCCSPLLQRVDRDNSQILILILFPAMEARVLVLVIVLSPISMFLSLFWVEFAVPMCAPNFDIANDCLFLLRYVCRVERACSVRLVKSSKCGRSSGVFPLRFGTTVLFHVALSSSDCRSRRSPSPTEKSMKSARAVVPNRLVRSQLYNILCVPRN